MSYDPVNSGLPLKSTRYDSNYNRPTENTGIPLRSSGYAQPTTSTARYYEPGAPVFGADSTNAPRQNNYDNNKYVLRSSNNQNRQKNDFLIPYGQYENTNNSRPEQAPQKTLIRSAEPTYQPNASNSYPLHESYRSRPPQPAPQPAPQSSSQGVYIKSVVPSSQPTSSTILRSRPPQQTPKTKNLEPCEPVFKLDNLDSYLTRDNYQSRPPQSNPQPTAKKVYIQSVQSSYQPSSQPSYQPSYQPQPSYPPSQPSYDTLRSRAPQPTTKTMYLEPGEPVY